MANTKLDVRVYPLDNSESTTKAFASVTVDDKIAIRGIRVIQGEKDLFMTMPQSKDAKKDEYHDIAFPVSGDLRKEIINAVLKEYDRVSHLLPVQRGYEKPEADTANNINVADIKLDIRVYPVKEPKGNIKAFASVTIDDTIAIRGVRIVDSTEKGLFVTMPQSKDKEDKYHDIAFPINGDLRKKMTKAILNKYSDTEKNNERKTTLAEGLKDGAAKANEHNSTSRDTAAKSTRLGVLD